MSSKVVIFSFTLSALSAFSASWKSVTREGITQYKKGNYKDALKDFDQALLMRSKSPAIEFNRGCASYKLKNYESAARSFEHAKTGDTESKDKAKSLYNLGNTLMETNNINGAIEAYKQALLLNPKDADIKHNLALALKRKQKPPESKKDDKSQGQNKDKDQKQRQPQQPQEQMSQQQLKALLEAFEQEEMEQAKKMQKKRRERKSGVDKDW